MLKLCNTKTFKYAAVILCILITFSALGTLLSASEAQIENTPFFAARFCVFIKNCSAYSLSGVKPPRFEIWLGDNETALKSNSDNLISLMFFFGCAALAAASAAGQALKKYYINISRKTMCLRI